MQGHENFALRRIVNILDAINRKNHDFSIVFKCTQEYRHESVMWVDEKAWLHKHVDFIEKEIDFSMMSNAKDDRYVKSQQVGWYQLYVVSS